MTSPPSPGGAAKPAKAAPQSCAERMAALGVVRDWDFVLHLPLRYEDETRITPVAELRAGMSAQVQGRVASAVTRFGRVPQLLATVEDATGALRVLVLNFYPSHRRAFEKGATLRLSGRVQADAYDEEGALVLINPRIKEPVSDPRELPAALTPVYPAGEHITQAWLRKRIGRALLEVDLDETVPSEYIKPLGLMPLAPAIRRLHSPPPGADLAAYEARTAPEWRRLKFDELLAQQIKLARSRGERDRALAPAIAPVAGGLADRFRAALPFALTGAQERVLAEIAADVARERPMHRLLQGDVGCGKTVVAALAALMAIDAGRQAALMAPTEILAEQHYRKISAWLAPLGVETAWLAGSLKAREKAEAQARIADGRARFAVGTHALIQQAVAFEDLGLAIVDEQHRFGVGQRLKLRRESAAGGATTHLLMLSATPIPRTLAMSYLSDMDVSVIDELPPGRSEVKTKLVSLARLDEVCAAIDAAIREDAARCYWVCPLIEESEKTDLAAVLQRTDYLAGRWPGWRVGVVHGAMAPADKEAIMARFAAGLIDVLVATTVIEVGVDVPEASVMVIERAERFGLAQLHQLRGRVGRGAAASTCMLLYGEPLSLAGKQRLRIIRENADGFAIAAEDLRLRGPGEFLGPRQSGQPMLRFADIEADRDLVEAASAAARDWLARDRAAALAHARRWFGGRPSYIEA